MTKRSINIDRLEIRTNGISAQPARSAVSDLGSELLDRLATAPATPSQNTVRIGRIDLGTLQVPAGSSAAELRGAIVQKVSAAIRSSLQTQSHRR